MSKFGAIFLYKLLLVLSGLQNSDFQSQFSMSKIIWIFLKKVLIEEYHLNSTFFLQTAEDQK